jgi:two-component system, chemotaxis family, response regulator Rcp1
LLSLRRVAEEQSVPIDILLVEDYEGDSRVMREVLGEINPTARLHVASDGAEAMDFLVVLLDSNLPKLHGRELLAHVKADPHLQTIRAIVLTGSEEESDVAAVIN